MRYAIIDPMFKHQITLRRMWRDLIINSLAASPLLLARLRRSIYRAYGMNLGIGTFISPRCFFGNYQLSIGDGCFVNYDCVFDNHEGPITIGTGCTIAMQVFFCTSTHQIGVQSCRAGAVTGKPIIVGNGCWIGARAMILPGVEIGSGTIVGAGSVVTKNCEPNCIYGGTPARLIRKLSAE